MFWGGVSNLSELHIFGFWNLVSNSYIDVTLNSFTNSTQLQENQTVTVDTMSSSFSVSNYAYSPTDVESDFTS